MSSTLLRWFLCLCLTIPLAACDVGRSDLEEDPPDDPSGDGPPTVENTCSARIDGAEFSASQPGASTNDFGTTFDMTCGVGGTRLIVELSPDGFGAATLALGVAGNQAQYNADSEATNTAELPEGTAVGEVVFTTFTRDRAEGTFRFDVPGFSEGDPVIRIRGGRFDVPVRLELDGG